MNSPETSLPLVFLMVPDELYSSVREITAVDHQVRSSVHLQDRKHYSNVFVIE